MTSHCHHLSLSLSRSLTLTSVLREVNAMAAADDVVSDADAAASETVQGAGYSAQAEGCAAAAGSA